MPSITQAWQWAVNTCNASNTGYSQAYRNGQTVSGITYYDCSSFINFAINAGGFTTPSYAPSNNAFTTGTMGAELLRLGFETVTDGSLKVGDIGVSHNSSMQHTEMVYAVSGSTAQWMGAHTSEYALDDQVSITSYWTGLWFDTLYRYNGTDTGITYTLSVTNGTASRSSGTVGQTATITASAMNGYKFYQWVITSGDITIADAFSSSTTVTFKSSNAAVEAQYRKVSSMSPVMWSIYPFIKNIDQV